VVIRYSLIAIAAVFVAGCSAAPNPIIAQASEFAAETPSSHLGQWYWIGLTRGSASKSTLAPEHYTLDFQSDGVVLVRADCNQGRSSYVLSAGTLSIEAPAMSKMGCGEQSQDRQFLAEIVKSQGFKLSSAKLFLDVGNDAQMVFARSAGETLAD